jgi:hypothetical protein
METLRIPGNVDPSFIEGINAFLQGKLYKDNPHKLGSFERAIWHNAWTWAEEKQINQNNVIEKLSQIKNWGNLDDTDY